MKHSVMFVLLAICGTGIIYTAHAAEFDENSANMTNIYAPFSQGSVLVYDYYAPLPDADPPCTDPTCMKPTGMVEYWHCAGPDVVDGVKCLRVNKVQRGRARPDHPEYEAYYNIMESVWYAQSTDGGVYLLQELRYHKPTGSEMITYGAANAELRMPPEEVLVVAGVISGCSRSIGGITSVGDLTLGATGLGTFRNCVKGTHEKFGDCYVAPGIGTVRYVDPDGAFHELVAWEFPLAVKTSRYDINGDEKTGLEEAVYALQVAAGMSPDPGIFQLTTDAFPNNEIPIKYTCKSPEPPVSPPFSWVNPPLGTKSFVLIADNLDSVPVSGFALDHWLIYDIPSTENGLSENAAANLPSGAKHGMNREGRDEYSGPCASDGSGINRYYFRLYALNVANLNPIQTNKIGIQAAMVGHVLGQTELVGTYIFAKESKQPE